MIDLEALRAATPGVASVAHFNNAGAALPSTATLEAMTRHLVREATVGGYEAQDEAAEELAGAHDSLARLVGAESDEVAFVDTASRAWAIVVSSIDWRPGDRILTARSEYGSNGVSLHRMVERLGVEVHVVADGADGTIDVAALRAALDERVRLVSLTHVPGTNGLVQPAAEVGRALAGHGALYLLDGAQSLGQVPTDMEAIGCDVVVGTARKYLRGPRGVGFVIARRSAELMPDFPQLASVASLDADGYVAADRPTDRFESWEGSIAARLGLGVAVDEALALGVDRIGDRVAALAETIRGALTELGRVAVHDRGTTRCGIVTFSVDEIDAAELCRSLRGHGINTSVSRSKSSPFDPDGPGWSRVRASVHAYNSLDEIDRLVDGVRQHRHRRG